jgi:Flp pilus assembly protein TadG
VVKLVKQWLSVRERGQALVLFAAGLGFFLALVGISIDVGQLVQARTDLQKIADAGAFAGSQDLPYPAKATDTANTYITRNGQSDCSSSCVTISTTDESNDTITVVTKRQVNYTFLRVLGLTGHTVTARAKLQSRYATGYRFDDEDVFPYAVWGGNGDTGGCKYGMCKGSLQIYRDNGYAAENVEPSPNSNPNWQVNSNKFKGYFHHGTDVYQIDSNEWQTFSYGGNAIGQEPIDALHEHYVSGEPIILPVISAARDCNGCPLPDGSGSAQGVQFKIVAWVAVKLTVDPANVSSSKPFEGTVVANYSSPHGQGGGEQNIPTDIAPRTVKLLE